MKKANVYNLIILEVVLLLISVITFKTMIVPNLNTKIKAGLTWDHKVDYDYILSADNPEITEVITLDLPDIRAISIAGRIQNLNPDDNARLSITLTDLNSNTVLIDKAVDVATTFPEGNIEADAETLKLKLKDAVNASTYELCVKLINPGMTTLVLSSNYKPGIVDSVNGDTNNKNNIITEVRYSSVHHIRFLYLLIVIIMLIFTAVSYYLINIRRYNVTQFYIPMMIILGIAYQLLIPVGGTPDESWHIDTAYKYSDIIMFSGDTGNPGTIYKRVCDVIQSDMLGNNVETNSYYQLFTNTFTRPDDTSLIEVQYTDASGQVPGIVYIPAAIGISIGRLLGLSAMLTYMLGRFIPLLFYSLIIWLAIMILPYGRNVMALVSLLPITIQQAGSMSYDCVIICFISLYIAIILRILSTGVHNKRLAITAAILAAFIAISKGGAYLPIILLAFTIPYMRKKMASNTKSDNTITAKKKIIIIASAAIILILLGALTYIKFADIYGSMNVADRADGNTSTVHYTISYLLQYPKVLLAILWNTPIAKADEYLLGLLGGRLGWNTIKAGFIYVLPFLLSLILMANADSDRMKESKVVKIMLLIPCILSAILITIGLLLGNTEIGNTIVEGVQGRYFLPYAGLLFMLSSNSTIHVDDHKLKSLWNVVTITEFVFVIRCLTITMG